MLFMIEKKFLLRKVPNVQVNPVTSGLMTQQAMTQEQKLAQNFFKKISSLQFSFF